MRMSKYLGRIIAGGVCAALLASVALAENFNIPGGDLKSALDVYAKQTGVALVVSGEAIRGVRTKGAKGELSADDALVHILAGTGFAVHHNSASAITIVR